MSLMLSGIVRSCVKKRRRSGCKASVAVWTAECSAAPRAKKTTAAAPLRRRGQGRHNDGSPRGDLQAEHAVEAHEMRLTDLRVVRTDFDGSGRRKDAKPCTSSARNQHAKPWVRHVGRHGLDMWSCPYDRLDIPGHGL
mmetsp:Transcript_118101/g.338793  ORF Transcript_118101/g.338793 Transcript_118101/m.338793 type:complete len:138 (-) Transcript_118101:256-669(-)